MYAPKSGEKEEEN